MKLAIELYEVNPKYIDYLLPHAPHLFQNKQPGQHNERKYIGIILCVNDMKYFAPLSSFKAKHGRMKNVMILYCWRKSVCNINQLPRSGEREKGIHGNNRGMYEKRWADHDYHEENGESINMVQKRNMADKKDFIKNRITIEKPERSISPEWNCSITGTMILQFLSATSAPDDTFSKSAQSVPSDSDTLRWKHRDSVYQSTGQYIYSYLHQYNIHAPKVQPAGR